MMKSLAGKKRGSVVEHDWYRVEPPAFADHVVPVGMWFDRFGPEKGKKHVHGFGVRLNDGRWQLQPTHAAAKKKGAVDIARGDTRFAWAESTEQLVRKKMKELRPRNIRARTIDENVQSSYLFPGRTTDWMQPDPFYVLVYTEYGNLRDPWEYDLVEYFNTVADSISSSAWYDDAGWENINSAVSYFWVRPKMIA